MLVRLFSRLANAEAVTRRSLRISVSRSKAAMDRSNTSGRSERQIREQTRVRFEVTEMKSLYGSLEAAPLQNPI